MSNRNPGDGVPYGQGPGQTSPFHNVLGGGMPGAALPRILLVDNQGRPCPVDLNLLAEVLRAGNERRGAEHMPEEITTLRGISPENRGNAAIFTPDSINTEQPILRVVPKVPGCWDVSVTLGLTPQGTEPDGLAQDSEAIFQAHLSWGVAGASFDAWVDISRGTVVNVCAGSLYVSAKRLTPLGPDPDVLGTYSVSASVGYNGVGFPTSSQTFTDRLGFLGPGLTARSVVPNFAKAFTVVASSVGAETDPVFYSPLRIDVLAAAASNIVNTFEYTSGANTAGQRETQFPIFNGARYIDVTNLDIEHTPFVQVIYSLTL